MSRRLVYACVALPLALALAAGGCCPGCYLLKKGYQAVTGTGDKPAEGQPEAPVQATKAQTTCPVMGGKINRELYVDYEGKRIYVCCSDCIAEVRKDPAKHIRQLEAAGVTLDTAPAREP